MPQKAKRVVRRAVKDRKATANQLAPDNLEEATTITAARIAAQFGKEKPELDPSPEEIAVDALRLAEIGAQVRKALEQKRGVQRLVTEAAEIAQRYGAQVVDHRDLGGWVMCLKFPEGRYLCGIRNWFVIA